jgi:hypothetical protein
MEGGLTTRSERTGADKIGRRYAKVADVDIGSKLVVDDGFACIKPRTVRHVWGNRTGLFVKCRCGRHYLDGQIEPHANGAFYVGMYLVEPKARSK